MPTHLSRVNLLVLTTLVVCLWFAPGLAAQETVLPPTGSHSGEHPHGWLSLVPPLVAVTLAVATRRIVLSLLVAIVVGSLITTREVVFTTGNLLLPLAHIFEIHLWTPLVEQEMLRLFAFTSAIGATVGIIYA